MKLKDICTEYNIPYDSRHSSDALKRVENELLLYKKGKNDYDVIRHLTVQEQRERDIRIKIKPELEKLICTTLAFSNDYAMCGSIKDYYELFYLVNEKFKTFKSDRSIKLCDKGLIYHLFNQEVDIAYHRIVKECFESLERKMIIHIEKKLVFVRKANNRFVKGYASEEERSKMLEAGKRAMTQYGYDEYTDIKYCDKEKVKDAVCKELGIEYFYNDYNIALNKEHLEGYRQSDGDICKKVNELSANKIKYSRQGVLKEMATEDVLECIDELIKI